MKNNKISVWCCAIAVLWGIGCQRPQEPLLSDIEKMEEVDRISRRSLDSLRATWRSHCDTNFDAMVQHAIDSMVEEYIKTHGEFAPDTLQ